MHPHSTLLDQKRITANELERLLQARRDGEVDFDLIDVREPYEYEAGHIAGVDWLLPTSVFEQWASLLVEAYREKPLILTCRTSNRTAQVQAILSQMGIGGVVDHAGGIVEYTGAIVQGMDGVKGVTDLAQLHRSEGGQNG